MLSPVLQPCFTLTIHWCPLVSWYEGRQVILEARARTLMNPWINTPQQCWTTLNFVKYSKEILVFPNWKPKMAHSVPVGSEAQVWGTGAHTVARANMRKGITSTKLGWKKKGTLKENSKIPGECGRGSRQYERTTQHITGACWPYDLLLWLSSGT